MPPHAPASPIKTWTSHEPASSAKWIIVFWLSLILAILLGLFVWWMMTPKSPITFYTSVAIEDYRDLLPKPFYPVWSSEEIERLQQERNLVPWKALEENGLISGRDLLGSVIGSLPDKLKRNEIASQDTLVLQLRTHCEAHTNADGKLELDLLTGEKATESTSEIERYAFKDLIKTLRQVPAQNIIVLADICDLDYAPQIGLAVNPVASALKELCASEPAVKGQNIWILCAARDGDSNYISHLRRKTLLQSACEFALDRGSNQTDDKSDYIITLAEFYQQVWRYCRRATKTTSGGSALADVSHQLPVLMRIGAKELVQPEDSRERSWDAAQQVFLTRIKNVDPAKAAKEKEQSDKPAENNSASAKSSSAPSQANDQPLDSVLQYWQLRDQLQSTKTKWPPAMFAPHHWQAHQLDVARRQFDLNNTENAAKIDNALDELKTLLKEMTAVSVSNDNQPSLRLVSSFREFKQDETLKNVRKPWEQSSQLLANDAPQWITLSNNYRKYSNASADIPAWAEWYRQDFSNVNNFGKFAECLVILRKILPKDGSAILDQKESFDTHRIEECREQLSNTFKKLHGNLKIRFEKKNELDWHDEHLLQELLQSPLLDFELRKDLWQAWQKILDDPDRRSHIIEPDKSSLQFNRHEKIASDTGVLDKSLPIWGEAIGRLGQLANVTGTTLKSDWTSSSGSTWHEFGEKIYQATAPYPSEQDARLHDWHVRCLSGMLPDKADVGFSAGIVLPASVSRALQVRVGTNNDTPIKFGAKSVIDLAVGVQRADSSEVNQVWLSWKMRTPTASATKPYLSITYDDRPLTETRQLVKVNNRTLRLRLNSLVDSRSVKAPLEIDLLMSENEAEPPTSTTLRVIPLQPDKVELTVHRAVGSELLKVDKQQWHHDLNTLAVQGAQSHFKFSLTNLSSQAKQCQVSVYALPATANLSTPPKNVTIQTFQKDYAPFAQSLPIKLPEAEVGREQPIAVELKPAASPSSATDSKSPPPQHGWLYFQIQELDEGNKPKSETAEFCRLRGISPTDAKLVMIKTETQSNFRLFVEPNPKVWAEHGLTELLIKTDVYDSEGALLKPPPVPKKISLSSGVASIVVVENNDPGNVVNAYLTIGSYPRAIAYESTQGRASAPNVVSLDVGSIKGLTTTPPAGAFKPLEPKPGDGIEMNARNRVYVFPSKDQEGGLITYDGLTFKASIDVPYSVELLDDMGGNLIGAGDLIADTRQMRFDWKLQDGDFELSATAADVELTVRPGLELKGRLKLNIKDGNKNIAPSGAAVLIFDSEPPAPITIRRVGSSRDSSLRDGSPIENGQSIDLTIGSPLTLRIQARDAGNGSGVEMVQMFIRTGANQRKELKTVYRDTSRDWECRLEPDDYKSERGEFTIVATSKDYAGNEQFSHPKVKVRLKSPPAPPKPDDKAK